MTRDPTHLAAIRTWLASEFPAAAVEDYALGADGIEHAFVIHDGRQDRRLLVGWDRLDAGDTLAGAERTAELLRGLSDGMQVVLTGNGPRVALAPRDPQPWTYGAAKGR